MSTKKGGPAVPPGDKEGLAPGRPAVPLRMEVRETFLALKAGGGKGWASQVSVSPQALALLPPPPIIGLPAPLPSACNFLPRRWREGNVKDDGLKGAVGVRRGGTTGLEGKRNRRKEGALNKADTKSEGDRKLDGEGRTWRL